VCTEHTHTIKHTNTHKQTHTHTHTHTHSHKQKGYFIDRGLLSANGTCVSTSASGSMSESVGLNCCPDTTNPSPQCDVLPDFTCTNQDGVSSLIHSFISHTHTHAAIQDRYRLRVGRSLSVAKLMTHNSYNDCWLAIDGLSLSLCVCVCVLNGVAVLVQEKCMM